MAGTGQLLLDAIALSRGGRQLFSGLSLSLSTGQAVRVTGANGAGKSSLLRMIAGFLAASEGQCHVQGKLALLGELHALDADRALGEALRFWAKVDGQGADAVTAAMTSFSIDHLAEVPVRMLSTGQRKRAALARVMASGADIWLLDEPSNGLDQASIALLEAAMAAHRAAGGIIVLASHQPIALPDAAVLEIGS